METNQSQAIAEQNTVSQNADQNAAQASSQAPSVESKDQIKALLAEARNTREMLVGFASAVETGTYSGGKMIELAKGLSFLDAILRQNNAHIQNLQDRLK